MKQSFCEKRFRTGEAVSAELGVKYCANQFHLNFRFCAANLKSSFLGIFNSDNDAKAIKIAAKNTFKLHLVKFERTGV